ncbi:MAG: ParB/RepB/Spo0J family partition protein [Christensenellaceae bacterium]|nr:ParB/RepB/Spo0J family partition protein [Christensenellaceae bacterium]MEA5069287.1 ParB/RepB/Spo0J family partition protein [Christensenellaceae bacterium]
MAKAVKHALGRGLDALLGGAQASEAAPMAAEPIQPGDAVLQLRIADIDPNRTQPRRRFDEDALGELAASIASVGVIQPVIVRELNGRYQLIAGERRWRAARMAGLSEIPAIVRDWDEVKRLEVALIENLQRDDLNPIEEAQGVRQLMEQCGYTQEAAAERLGKSRSALANLLRLLTLDGRVLMLVEGKQLSAGHARALVAIEDKNEQVRLANLCMAQGWSVRQLEKICQQARAGADEAPVPKAAVPREVRELERLAREAFGTKAQLDGDLQKGKLVLHYYSADDLQRIWDVLAGIR